MGKIKVGFVSAGWMGSVQMQRITERDDAELAALFEKNADRGKGGKRERGMKKIGLVLGCLLVVGLFAKSDIFAKDIALYHFNEGKGEVVKDSSGNNNHGRIINGATWVEGKTGTAIYLKGKESFNYIEVPDSETLRFTGKFSIEFWWKKKGSKGTHIFFRKSKRSRFYNYYAYDSSRKIYFNICDRNKKTYSITVPFHKNGWHQFAFVYDEQNLKIYIDKELAASKEIGKITLYTDKSPLYIGTFQPGYKSSLKGALDEFCIRDEIVIKEERWVKSVGVTDISVYEIKLPYEFQREKESVRF